jgi:hypothetical protein
MWLTVDYLARQPGSPALSFPRFLGEAAWANDYVDGLAARRYRGPAPGKEAHEGLNLWIGGFAGACTRAVDDAASLEQRVRQIQDR